MDFVKLKTEIANARYAGKGDEELAIVLNAVDRLVDRESIDGGTIASCIVKSEFTTLSAIDRAYLQMLIPAQNIPVTTTLKQELGNLFGVSTGTRANLLAAIKRPGSRAEEIGLGEKVTASHVAEARK